MDFQVCGQSLARSRDAQGATLAEQDSADCLLTSKRKKLWSSQPGQSYISHQNIKPVKMAGDCTHTNDRYANAETFCPSKPWSDGAGERAGEMESAGISKGRVPTARWAPNFEVIDGLLYRKKLERGFINYREVLDEDRRHEAVSTFHRRQRPGQRHLSLEETYKCVAENYWWEGMNITACLYLISLDSMWYLSL